MQEYQQPHNMDSHFSAEDSNTTWEVFDKDFNKIGLKLDWNDDEGLKNP